LTKEEKHDLLYQRYVNLLAAMAFSLASVPSSLVAWLLIENWKPLSQWPIPAFICLCAVPVTAFLGTKAHYAGEDHYRRR
jgi:hypothetical protein